MGFEVAGASQIKVRRLIRLPDEPCLSISIGDRNASGVT